MPLHIRAEQATGVEAPRTAGTRARPWRRQSQVAPREHRPSAASRRPEAPVPPLGRERASAERRHTGRGAESEKQPDRRKQAALRIEGASSANPRQATGSGGGMGVQGMGIREGGRCGAQKL